MAVRGPAVVNMDMNVVRTSVRMLMHMDLVGHRLARAPKADGDQGHADQSFRPRGKEFHRQHLAQQQREHPDQQDAAGVTESPAQTRGPALLAPPNGQRRDGRQMIRTGEDMDESGNGTGKHSDHDGFGFNAQRDSSKRCAA